MIKFIIMGVFIVCIMIYTYIISREYKKIETLDEKVAWILLVLIIVIPLIAYYIDEFNILTKIGMFKGSNPNKWFNFFETYISSLIGSIIGAVALIIMTKHQLDYEREKNREEKEMQNAPFFKYEISNIFQKYAKEYIIFNNLKNGTLYNLYINMENIGLNHAKDIELCINDGVSKKGNKYTLDSQSIIKKDESKVIKLCFNYKYDEKKYLNNTKNIEIKVKYKDLLNNIKTQKINIKVEVTDEYKFESRGKILIISSIIVS